MKTIQDKYDWIKHQLDAGEHVWFYTDNARICLITEEDDFSLFSGCLYFCTSDLCVDFSQKVLFSTADGEDATWWDEVNQEIYDYA